MVVKVNFEGTVKRVYEEQRGERVNKYVVVTDGRDKYPNVLRFKVKPTSDVRVDEGAVVKVEAYLDGREWEHPEKGPMYFTDLTISTIEVLEAAKPGSAVTDWAGLLAFGKANGEDEAKVKERCVAHKEKVNRRFTAADYAEIAAQIAAEHGAGESGGDEFTDEMPF